MEILITSKTHKGKAACVGGLVTCNNKFVRLLNPGNWDQYSDTNFVVGDIWDINFTERKDITPPHIEDIIISSQSYIKNIEHISDFIKKSGVTIYKGSPNKIFNGLLGWTGNGSGFLENKVNLPCNSVGFWISDKDLLLQDKHYHYPANNAFTNDKRFPYVGFENAVDIIPAGTLMRISLARWWKPEDSDAEERCYLQLSGWYNLEVKANKSHNDGLPF